MTSKYTVDSPWYRSLNRAQWKALVASNLGWTFDGFEVFALILTIGAALHQLLDPSEYKYIPFYAGAVIAITVFGWGAGGLLGGILADERASDVRQLLSGLILHSSTQRGQTMKLSGNTICITGGDR
jgi:hypothetical protein